MILGTVEGLAVAWEDFGVGWQGRPGHSDGVRIKPGAIKIDRNVEVYVKHERDVAPIGSVETGELEIWSDDRGLWFRCNIPNTAAGREAYTQLQRGELRGASVSYIPIGINRVGGVRESYSSFSKTDNIIDKAYLTEISLTNNPVFQVTQEYFTWTPATSQRRSDTMETTERRIFKTNNLRFDDSDGTPKITGLAVPYNAPSEDLGGFREIFKPGAFRESLASGDDIFADVDHESNKRLARRSAGTLRLRDSRDGLYVTIMPPDTTLGRDTIEEVKKGLLDAMSIAFADPSDVYKGHGKETIREIVKAKLCAITLTDRPAYPQTAGTVAQRSLEAYRKKAKPRTNRENAEYIVAGMIDYYTWQNSLIPENEIARARLDIEEALLV